MIKRILVQTIPHNEQRYDTIGDWLISGDLLTLKVSELGDWRESFVCAIHEACEAALCANEGIAEEPISRFDMLYEDRRQAILTNAHVQKNYPLELVREFGCKCIPTEDSEPGEDRHAPYRKQHAFADGIERLLANALGVVWSEYSEKVTNLDYQPSGPVERERGGD